MSLDRPLLSIGMIVKNEMRCLKRCLDALAPLRAAVPSELVIADTGSTDGTRELAAQYADVLFDFEWCNDFSAARNAVLDRCSGLWHLQVDADEYLDADFSELISFVSSRYDRNKLAYVVIRSYRTAEMLADDYSDFYASRLFYIPAGIRYSGAIHESPGVPGGELPANLLLGAILHHDGYTDANIKEKQMRNLPLLEKELAKDPTDLRRILQCLESTYTREDRYRYAKLAFEAAQRGAEDEREQERLYRISMMHAIITRTIEYEFDEIPQWAVKAKELFPESILIRTGVSYAYGLYLYNSGRYEESLAQLEEYFAGINDFENKRFNIRELSMTPVLVANMPEKLKAHAARIRCLAMLGRLDELELAIAEQDIPLSCGGSINEVLKSCADGLIRLWQAGREEARLLLAKVYGALNENSAEYDAFIGECRAAFENAGDDGNADTRSGLKGWQLFASLGSGCDLGRFGLLMGAADRFEAEILLNMTQRPDLIPPEVLVHALELGAKLPDEFCRMKAESIAALSVTLAKLTAKEPDKAMKIWPACEDADPGRALFGFNFASELAGNVDWDKQGSLPLFEYYCRAVEKYVTLFFNPLVCTAENMYALPVLTRFALCCMDAGKCLHSGDELGYVRALRAGLAACPGMKNMVAYLTDKAESMLNKVRATPEMMALATQIRAILAQFPADDPTVQYLKNSEEYKLVAHLIEG